MPARIKRMNVMLDEDDVALIDKYFPQQRSEIIRGLIRRFCVDKLEPMETRSHDEQ